jgi:hypothetical protein
MKKFYLGFIALLIVLSISGCSGDEPSDVAVDFANSLSNLDIKSAKNLSSLGRTFNSLEKKCSLQKVDELEIILNNYDMGFIDNGMKEEAKKLQDKYPNGIQHLPKDEQTEILTDFVNSLDIKVESADLIKQIMIKTTLANLSGKRFRERQIIQNILLENGNNVTSECLSNYTPYANIDDINVLETISISADKSTVRLELIYEDNKSAKVAIKLEKIQDIWKVVNPDF